MGVLAVHAMPPPPLTPCTFRDQGTACLHVWSLYTEDPCEFGLPSRSHCGALASKLREGESCQGEGTSAVFHSTRRFPLVVLLLVSCVACVSGVACFLSLHRVGIRLKMTQLYAKSILRSCAYSNATTHIACASCSCSSGFQRRCSLSPMFRYSQ